MEEVRKYINIPPGKIILRRLETNKITQSELARRVGIASQELNAIIKGRRGLPLDISLRIETELSLAEGFLSQLQLLNAIERIKKDSQSGMPAPNVRRILFWDTDFDKINWKYSKRFVINRVEKYGSSEEIQTIRDYYEL